jgi:hypothetical protein
LNKLAWLTIFGMLALAALAATPVFAAGESDFSFLGVDYITGKGLAVYFKVSEDSDFILLPNYVVIEDVNYPLDCQTRDNDEFICLAKVKKSAIGEQAEIHAGGRTFTAVVPEARVRLCNGYRLAGYTYSVYDYDLSLVWYEAGTHTQSCPAEVGDAIPFLSPDWGDTELHYYSLDGVDRCAPSLGDGYYFDSCW